MNYAQAKLAAYDYTITDWRLLRRAASKLLARLNASDEDLCDAEHLIQRADEMKHDAS